MSDPTDLTPAEVERLAMLAEECAEVIQIVGKILRHGYQSWHPKDPTTSNRALLRKELTDLHAVHLAMIRAGDQMVFDPSTLKLVWLEKLRYTHHQEKR